MEVFAFSITAFKIESDHGGPESTRWSISVVKHSSWDHNATTYLMERGAVAMTNNLLGRCRRGRGRGRLPCDDESFLLLFSTSVVDNLVTTRTLDTTVETMAVPANNTSKDLVVDDDKYFLCFFVFCFLRDVVE